MPATGFAPSHPCPERQPQGTPSGSPRAANNGSAVIIMLGGTRIEFRDQLASYVVECAALVEAALRGPAAFAPQGSTGSATSTARTTATKRRDRRKASTERARQERAADAAPPASPVPERSYEEWLLAREARTTELEQLAEDGFEMESMDEAENIEMDKTTQKETQPDGQAFDEQEMTPVTRTEADEDGDDASSDQKELLETAANEHEQELPVYDGSEEDNEPVNMEYQPEQVEETAGSERQMSRRNEEDENGEEEEVTQFAFHFSLKRERKLSDEEQQVQTKRPKSPAGEAGRAARGVVKALDRRRRAIERELRRDSADQQLI